MDNYKVTRKESIEWDKEEVDSIIMCSVNRTKNMFFLYIILHYWLRSRNSKQKLAVFSQSCAQFSCKLQNNDNNNNREDTYVFCIAHIAYEPQGEQQKARLLQEIITCKQCILTKNQESHVLLVAKICYSDQTSAFIS